MNATDQNLEKAINYHQKGDLEQAEKLYTQLLKTMPNNLELLYLNGIIHCQTKNYPQAISFLTKALNNNTDQLKCKEILVILAEIYSINENINETITCLKKIIEMFPHDFDANISLGSIYLDSKDINSAIHHYKQVLITDPYCLDIYINLVIAYKVNNDIENVINCYNKMIEIEPNEAKFHFELGEFLETVDKHRAIESYNKAISLRPDYTEVYINLACLYHNMAFYDTALECSLKALEINPNFIDIYNVLGNIYIDTKHVNSALNISEQGLKLYPGSVPLKFNISRAKMLAGKVEEGWDYFKYRKIINERKSLGLHLFDYSGSLKGKTVYVYWDNGLGDTIQFIRYLPLLNNLGAKVLFKGQRALESLIMDSNFPIELIPDSTDENTLKYDFQLNLASLPYLFKSSIDNFPFKDKFLNSNPEKVKRYKEKFFNTDKFKVGIVWQSSDINSRSISNISSFFSIAQMKNVQLYSLQKGPGEIQLENLPNNIEIINLGSTFNDFTDTAAAMENIDLLISVDTSVAHLAGAMQKPAWVMLNHVPNWRWFLDRSDSPWYNSIKLFRQSDSKDWTEVINGICKELSSLLENQ